MTLKYIEAPPKPATHKIGWWVKRTCRKKGHIMAYVNYYCGGGIKWCQRCGQYWDAPEL